MKKLLSALPAMATNFTTVGQTTASTSIITQSASTVANLSTQQLFYHDVFAEDDQMYETVTLINLANLLTASGTTGIVHVSIPGGPQNMQFKVGNYSRRDNGDYYWYGHRVDPNAPVEHTIAITVVNGYAAGTIDLHDEGYEITDIGEGQMVLLKYADVSDMQFAGCNLSTDQTDPEEPAETMSPCVNLKQRVLVLFDNGVSFWHTNTAIASRAQHAVDQSNQCRVTSMANTQNLELAAVVPFAFTSTSDPDLDVATLAADAADPNTTVGSLKIQHAADLVVLLFYQQYQSSGSETQGQATKYPIHKSKATALVRYKWATHHKYHVFAHEIHHLYDARHQSDITAPPYAHAMELFSGGFIGAHFDGTIMFSQDGGQPIRRELALSTPNVSLPIHGAQEVLGTATVENNTQRVEETEQEVANYFEDNPPATMQASLHVAPLGWCDVTYNATCNIYCGVPPYTVTWLYSSNSSGLFTSYQSTSATTTVFTSTYAMSQAFQSYVSGTVVALVSDAAGNFAYASRSIQNFCEPQEEWIGDDDQARLSSKSVISRPSVSPNPSTGMLQIQCPVQQPFTAYTAVRYTVTNTLGQQVASSLLHLDFAGTAKTVLPSQLPNGLYYLTIHYNQTNYAYPIEIRR